MTEPLSTAEYLEKFKDPAKALEYALDTRKFEIELYWKRATYFWTFIAATLGGYAALQLSSVVSEEKTELSILLCCLGFVFSIGWFCVNKGSKKWQENWEKHVSLLEDKVIGPLYKTVWDGKTVGFVQNLLTGPDWFSVSKINQIISFFVSGIWLILYGKAVLPTMSVDASVDWVCVIATCFALGACILFLFWGTTDTRPYRHVTFNE